MLVAGLLGFLVLVSGNADSASAAVQGEVVPEDARRDLPVVLDGRVLAHAQVGDRIFVGGDFQQVELIDGTVIDQPYLFAYDIDTGIVDPNFRPAINNLIRTLESAEDGSGLYVGGRFTRWDNSFPLRIAKLDAEGVLDTSFTTSASARVQSISQAGDWIYLGGDFTDVSGVPASGLVRVNRLTGAVDTSWVPSFQGSINGSQLVRRVEVQPGGNQLFVLHYATLVEGQTREAVAKFNIATATPSLSGWNIPWSAQAGNRNCWSALRDLAISPDGSFLVIGGQGADNPPNCDSVLRYPTAGEATVNFDWSARMYSSVFSLAVSDVSVYVGGHFCAAPRNGAPPGGVTSTFPGTANGCDINNPNAPINPSSIDPEGAVFRGQLAALNPSNGQALAWDPGSNNFVGVFDLTLIERGLLAGHDRDRFSTFLVGRSGFFDLDANSPDTSAPDVFITSPGPDAVLSTSPSELAGSAVDDREVTEVVVRLRNLTTGQNLQPNGTFGAPDANLPVNTTDTGLGQVAWTVPVNNLPPATYEIRSFAVDAFGNSATTVTSQFTIAGTASCTVALNADDQPVLTLDQFLDEGVNDLVIRRDGSFLESIDGDNDTYVDTSAQPGDRSYIVRWRPNGVVTDVTCSPNPITVPNGGGGAATCSAAVNGAGNVVLNWDIEGVTTFVIRDNDGWVATVDDVNSYTDTAPVVGDRTYVIRYRPAGTVTDLTCLPDPITVPNGGGGAATCSAAVNGAGNVILNWDIEGINTFQVRDNDGWVATVQGASTFTDTNPGNGDRTYIIRYHPGGTAMDVTCSPTVNAG